MPSLMKIPYSTVEYQARFVRPIIQLIAERASVVQAVVDALMPFGFRLTNTEVITQGGLAEQKIIFRLPDRNISFQFGAEECRFIKDGSSWSTSEEDLEVLTAGEGAVLAACDAIVQERSVTLAMHLQLLETPREEILSRFAPGPLFNEVPAEYKPVQYGAAIKWPRGGLLFDYSATVANGIFVRLTSDFDSIPSLMEIIAKVRRDEDYLFGVLDVEEVNP